MTKGRMACLLSCLLVFCILLVATGAHAQRIFFADRDPVVIRSMHQPEPTDYMDLFKADAPWAEAAAKVNVFSVSAQFVLSGTDDQLRSVFNNLKQRHIATAVEMGTVIRLDSCGMGEGYAPPGMAAAVAKRLHGLNLDLDYIVGDEPVTFAHSKTEGTAQGRPNCVYPVSVVVERTALTIDAVRSLYPQIRFGDIEVAAIDPRLPAEQRLADYVQFIRLLEARIGQKLAFFHADVAWRTNPLNVLAPMRAAIKAEGVPFGVIIGGSPKDTTDAAWEQDALSRLDLLQRNPATRLDDVVIDTWQSLPGFILPETTPGTSTNILLRAERLLANSAVPHVK